MIVPALALFLSVLPSAFPSEDLAARVALYWELLAKRDKASALELVRAETRNAFLQRREPQIRSWKLVKIETQSDSAALVTVEIERSIPGVEGFHRAQVVERWVLQDAQWRADVKKEDVGALAGPYATDQREPKPEPGSLRVVPATLRIPFLDGRRRGGIRLANGLQETAEVLRVEYDREKFELSESPQRVAPGQYGVFTLSYKGEEIAKDRPSELTLELRVGGQLREIQVPVVYNYLSPATRAFFGLTEEQAEKLRREDQLKPPLQSGAPPRKPPGG